MSRRVTAVIASVAAAYFATPVLLPAIVAVVMAVLVEPIARLLGALRLGRGLSSFAAVLLALGLTFGAGWGCYRAVAGVVSQVPKYSQSVRAAAAKAQSRLKRFQRRTDTLMPEAGGGSSGQETRQRQGEGSGQARDWSTWVWRGLGSMLEAVGLAVFVPFLALFLLIEQETLEAALDRAAGRDYDTKRLRAESARMLRAYVIGNLLLGAALAVVQMGLFAALGLDNAVGLGLVTGFLNVIPVLGLPLALLLPMAQGLASFDGAWQYAVLGASLVSIHLIAGNWVIPRTIGERVKVNATAGTLGMLFFYWLWGIVGFLLAVPLTALVKILLECSPRGVSLAALLAAEPQPARAGGRLRLWRRHGAVAGR